MFRTLPRAGIAAVAAVTSAAAGIVGGFLANRWNWGLAVGVLTLIGLFAALEGLKAITASRTSSPSSVQPPGSDIDEPKQAHPAPSVLHSQTAEAGVNVGPAGSFSMTGSTIANQANRTTIHTGGIVTTVMAALFLLAGGVGTITLATREGGRLADSVSATDVAMGTWVCERSGGGPDDRPIKAKIHISKDSWALVEQGEAPFREGGTWRLIDGRLEVESSQASFVVEEIPQELSQNRVLMAKERFPFSDRDQRRESSASYSKGIFTLRWEEYTFRCIKEVA